MTERSTSYEISLQSLCYKVDVEGPDYTVENYVDAEEFVADDPELAAAIDAYKVALTNFQAVLDSRRAEYDIEFS